jgi:soluble lytic murein transglycosylase
MCVHGGAAADRLVLRRPRRGVGRPLTGAGGAPHSLASTMLAPLLLASLLAAPLPSSVTEADLAPLTGGAEAQFVRAVALSRDGKAAEALRALDGLDARLPAIADRVRFLRGDALAALGRPRDAAAAWEGIAEESLLAPQSRIARARALRQARDREGALAALAPLVANEAPLDLSRPDVGATALLLAAELRAGAPSPDPAAARVLFLACWAGHPLAPEAAACRAALDRLPAPHGAAPGDAEVLRRAEALLELNRNSDAIALLEPVVKRLPAAGPGEPLACRAHAALGRAWRKERRHASAAESLRPVVDRCEDAALRVRAMYVLASSVSIAGAPDDAVALYRRLAREFPAHSFADDALFFAADVLARSGRVAEAREALVALARDYPKGDYRDEARFRAAWLARGVGDVDGAIAQLLAIEEDERDADPYEHARAAYWRARLLASKGEGGGVAARAIWSDLAVRYATDYYGLLARARLAEGGAPPPGVVAGAPVAPGAARYALGSLADDPHLAAGVLLLRMGLREEAARELNAVDLGRAAASGGEATEGLLLVADLLDRAGDHRSAHHLLRTQARAALRRAPLDSNARAWRVAYPAAFRADIERWAPPAGVPVDLLQALMREESALDPRIVSPAGAVGLTQLMLPTAQQVARRLKLPRPTAVTLMTPGVNIRIGARYLGDLLRQFDGSVALALAAYNAGGGAVNRWLDQRSDRDLDEFVEEIPIEETRGYVKRVLRSFAAYQLLYGKPQHEALRLGQGLPSRG